MIERVIRGNPSRIYRDMLHEFIDEVTDGAYNLPCLKVILKPCQADAGTGETRESRKE
jgi:hypothetical protein